MSSSISADSAARRNPSSPVRREHRVVPERVQEPGKLAPAGGVAVDDQGPGLACVVTNCARTGTTRLDPANGDLGSSRPGPRGGEPGPAAGGREGLDQRVAWPWTARRVGVGHLAQRGAAAAASAYLRSAIAVRSASPSTAGPAATAVANVFDGSSAGNWSNPAGGPRPPAQGDQDRPARVDRSGRSRRAGRANRMPKDASASARDHGFGHGAWRRGPRPRPGPSRRGTGSRGRDSVGPRRRAAGRAISAAASKPRPVICSTARRAASRAATGVAGSRLAQGGHAGMARGSPIRPRAFAASAAIRRSSGRRARRSGRARPSDRAGPCSGRAARGLRG